MLLTNAKKTILEAIGETPIVQINKLYQSPYAEIYVKCEYMNPGGSTKDRIAVHMIEQAEKEGRLGPGGTIVEATSGNTGMGLAMVAAVRGYQAIFVMPDKMSTEKIQAMQALGARVVITPTNVAPDDPRSVYKVAERIAKETPGAILGNQYHNPANPETHYISTGPEIWRQTNGLLDVFVATLGTGGTISGTGRYLKEQKPDLRLIGVDPHGSIYWHVWKHGEMPSEEAITSWKVEGIGEDFLPSTAHLKLIDEMLTVSDEECFKTAIAAVRREGLLAGGSSGGAIAAAIRYATQHGQNFFEKNQRPMVLLAWLPDSMSRYLSKCFSEQWMKDNGF